MPDPLILIDPTQQNDFTARAIAFPNDPLPGNLVDGEFAHIRAILGTAVNILQGITSPDGLSIGQVIGLDQLTPGALDALAQTVTDAVASDTANAQGAAVEATAQKNEATTQAGLATSAATAAIAALTVIEGAQAATVAAISALTPSAQESADNAADSASAALIMSAPMNIRKIMPLVCAVVRMHASSFTPFISCRSSVMAKVSTLPMAAPSVAVNTPP